MQDPELCSIVSSESRLFALLILLDITVKLFFSSDTHAKHVALRIKSKDWFVRNQDNVYVWGNMSMYIFI